MDYPKCKQSGAYRIAVPSLSGGVNLTAGLSFVEDNQLTACRNLYWKDGALRTRPGFQMQTPSATFAGHQLYFNGPVEWEGKRSRCLVTRHTEPDNKALLVVSFFHEDGTITQTQPITLADMEMPVNVLAFAGPATKGDGFYVLVGLTDGGRVFELDGSSWQACTEEDAYAPLVLVNGKGDQYSTLPSTSDTEAAPASLFEGVNVLFGRFRASYFTDGVSSVFQLPFGGLADKPITVQYLDNAKTTMTIPAGQTDSPAVPLLANAFARVDRETGIVSILHNAGDTNTPFPLPMVENLSNSLVITASLPVDAVGAGGDGSPFRMKQAVWFGGSALSDGSRLFLTGDPAAEGIVRWSDCASPLYFPENNYVRVGGVSPVNAMAKQEDMLVFFKDREIYSTSYVEGSDITADDILSGAVADVTAVSATFPVKQLHPAIGCDRPDSIQLCDNRLVFAHSDGGIYTLTAANAYSENNVCCLSRPIESAVPRGPRLFSADWDGYYLLFQAGEDLDAYPIVVMDYRSYGFRNAASYTRNKTDVPFFFWDNPVGDCLAAVAGPEGLTVIRNATVAPESTSFYPFLLTGEGDILSGADTAPRPVQSSFRTKLFDFGQPERNKRITALYLGAGGDGRLELSYVTERGQTAFMHKQTPVTGRQPDEAGYIQTLSLRAVAPRVKQFGLEVRASGVAAFSGIQMQYSTLR